MLLQWPRGTRVCPCCSCHQKRSKRRRTRGAAVIRRTDSPQLISANQIISNYDGLQLLATASNLLAMASNPLATASNVISSGGRLSAQTHHCLSVEAQSTKSTIVALGDRTALTDSPGPSHKELNSKAQLGNLFIGPTFLSVWHEVLMQPINPNSTLQQAKPRVFFHLQLF